MKICANNRGKSGLKQAARIVLLACACLSCPGSSVAAIIYQAFGPDTVDLNNPLTAPDFFGGSMFFGWQQPFFPTSTREGIFGTSDSTATISILTDGSGYSLLAEGTQIDANTSGTWSSPSGVNLLYQYTVSNGLFDGNYLSPSELGVIGLRTSFEGNFYYGWIEVSNITTNGLAYDVSGFLYNDTPDAPVLAGSSDDPSASPASSIPEPSSVGLTLLGAVAVYTMRRRFVD